MAKAGIILTTDYEIYGNGTGCVDKCMLQPTEKMAGILERYNAPLTIFFDVCEYWAFQKEYEKGTLKENWAGLIREQLQNLLKRGHDIQLHFHPQWLDYSYENGKWNLNYELWRIGNLHYEDTTHPDRGLKELFKRGKETLESIGREIDHAYSCTVFRAGAWSIQPEREVLKAMQANGFRIDSTVAAGLNFKDQYSYYDFEQAPDKPYWHVEDDLTVESNGGPILEIPIYTDRLSFSEKLKFLALRQKRKIPFKPEGCKGEALATKGKNKMRKLMEVLTKRNTMFTFGDATPYEEMIYFAEQAINRFKSYDAELLPAVAISHPKTFANNEDLEKFMKWAARKEEIEFTKYNTFNEY